MGELHHFGGQEPSFPHFHRWGNELLCHGRHLLERRPGAEDTLFLHHGNDVVLLAAQVTPSQVNHRLQQSLPVVNAILHHVVVHHVEHKVQQPRHSDFRPFGNKEVLQMIVGKGGIFHEDLPHHAHLHGLALGAGDRCKVPEDFAVKLLHVAVMNLCIAA